MIDVGTTIHFEQLIENIDKRIQLFQGGSRSAKTFNILIALFTLALHKPMVIDLTRRTLPALKATLLRDFIEIIEMFGLFDKIDWNKTDRIIKIKGSEFCYYSLDEETKVRGRKRDIIFINEVTELPYPTFQQILLRTEANIIADYNPSIEPNHWLNKIAAREDCIRFYSSYKDNPYLSKTLVKEIELLQETDAWMWQVFGLGKQAVPENIIFKFKLIDKIPEEAKFLGYGMDIGYQDPTVVVELFKQQNNLYVNEVIHEKHLTGVDIKNKFDEFKISKVDYIVSDVDPDVVETLRRGGYRIKPVKKPPGSKLQGIRNLKTINLFVTKRSVNVINELSFYKWKEDINGQPTDVPIHEFSHAPDAINYGYRTLGKIAVYAVR